MIFRRKNGKDGKVRRRALRQVAQDFTEFQVFLESPDDEVYRGQIDDTLVVQLDSVIEEPVKARLDDLCIQGASILIPVPTCPDIHEGEIFGVRIEHAQDGWTILTPALIRSITHETERYVRFGIEFVNPGNLYSQLENGLGQYFNRRSAVRYKESGRMPTVLIRHKGVKLRAKVADVSIAGLGIWVSHIEAAGVTPGDEIILSMKPPGMDPIECRADVARKEADGRRDLIGLHFDIEAWEPLVAQQYEDFVSTYLRKRLRWTA